MEVKIKVKGKKCHSNIEEPPNPIPSLSLEKEMTAQSVVTGGETCEGGYVYIPFAYDPHRSLQVEHESRSRGGRIKARKMKLLLHAL